MRNVITSERLLQAQFLPNKPVNTKAFLGGLKLTEQNKEQWLDFAKNVSMSWWPETCGESDTFIHRESDLHSYLLNNRMMQYRLGWHSIVKSQISCPDLMVRPYGAKMPKPAMSLLRVELEYDAVNFITHRHAPSAVQLVVSYRRPLGVYSVRGIPVWSLYEYDMMTYPLVLHWTLDKDIRRPLPPRMPSMAIRRIEEAEEE